MTSDTRTSDTTNAVEQKIVITRVFDAARERVFKAWTEPERVMRWWGPNGFTAPFCKIDLRPGGVFHNCMRSPEGQDFWSKGKTKFTLQHAVGSAPASERDQCRQGWSESLDRLAGYLAKA